MAKQFRSKFETPEESPGFLLWQVSSLWQRKQRAALLSLGLTHVQFVLLAGAAWLSKEGDLVTQVQIAEHTKLDVMMTSQVLRTLEDKGWIVRAPHPSDSRAKCIRVTKAGQKLVTLGMEAAEAVDQAFFAALGREQSKLVSLLRALAAAAEPPP